MLEEYYRENGLQRPQRIIAELQASRILRAVYSERQLQEVMVDFWTNHFNIFANKGGRGSGDSADFLVGRQNGREFTLTAEALSAGRVSEEQARVIVKGLDGLADALAEELAACEEPVPGCMTVAPGGITQYTVT